MLPPNYGKVTENIFLQHQVCGDCGFSIDKDRKNIFIFYDAEANYFHLTRARYFSSIFVRNLQKSTFGYSYDTSQ